jgi:hypothetical protein
MAKIPRQQDTPSEAGLFRKITAAKGENPAKNVL